MFGRGGGGWVISYELGISISTVQYQVIDIATPKADIYNAFLVTDFD